MGTVLYVVLRLMGRIDASTDLVNLCFLVSLDSIVLILLAAMRAKCCSK